MILNVEAILSAHPGLGGAFPNGVSQYLRLIPAEGGGFILESKSVSSRKDRIYAPRGLARFDQETGDKLLTLQEQGEKILAKGE